MINLHSEIPLVWGESGVKENETKDMQVHQVCAKMLVPQGSGGRDGKEWTSLRSI